ncbi:uncharacterized protein EV154DRAFT_52172 [Mucor mucedo]|uniref:uncharacterized protein n=1 Tax=Mucor mucedo TaxID=29922 RepID=UPI00222026E5|nr:uncharacterized protein EV154DRAFT_52172 [Mucor mucedo]KAI7879535.1 hypothetical protein EV154DRAFT_52172 [Mucor mucedo]
MYILIRVLTFYYYPDEFQLVLSGETNPGKLYEPDVLSSCLTFCLDNNSRCFFIQIVVPKMSQSKAMMLNPWRVESFVKGGTFFFVFLFWVKTVAANLLKFVGYKLMHRLIIKKPFKVPKRRLLDSFLLMSTCCFQQYCLIILYSKSSWIPFDVVCRI